MKTPIRKRCELYKFLRGPSFEFQIGLPRNLALWIAKKVYPVKKIKWPEVVVESGWVRDSTKTETEK